MMATWIGRPAALAARAWSEHRFHGVPLRLGMDPVLPLRHFAAVCLIVIGGLVWHRIGFRGFTTLFAPFIHVAPISYALYVIHFPILMAGIFDGVTSPWLRGTAYLTVFLGLAWGLEIHLQGLLNRIAKPWIRGAHGAGTTSTPAVAR